MRDAPLVVFAHHRDVVDHLAAALREAGRTVVLVTGDTETDERQANVDAFQQGHADVILGTLGAMGTGLTLTRSTHVVIGELDWSPDRILQAEDRCHRIGQQGSVHVEHIVFEGSLDARLVEALEDKKAVQHAGLDAVPEMPAIEGIDAPATVPTMAEVTAPSEAKLDDEALRQIEAEAAAAVEARAERKCQEAEAEAAREAARRATDDEVRAKLRAALDAAGWGLGAKDHAEAERLAGTGTWAFGGRVKAQVLTDKMRGFLDRAAERVGTVAVDDAHLARAADPDVRAAALEACRHLSGLDVDRASEDNGVGWSRSASWDGHWLAGHETLDERETAHALALLSSYHRQLDPGTWNRLFGPGDASASEAIEVSVEPVAADEVAVVAEQGPEDEQEPAPVKALRRPGDAAPEPAPAPAPEPAPAEPEPSPAPVAAPAYPRLARRAERQAAARAAEAARLAAPVSLAAIGEAAFGPRWQTDLARDLGVNDRTVRRWESGATPMPAAMQREVLAIVERRQAALAEVLGRMREQMPGIAGTRDGEVSR